MEVEAESKEEAEDMGHILYLHTEWNGTSVFTNDDNVSLEADGEPRDITVELIEGSEDEDDEE